ncbi:2-aminoadipate transaminase isoform X2 [Eurosta solidaginis]|uniref:2-aminoadipate transaminase isoform X2 n=1 Tax=Eurosta solidaginis TaxID=178769 RepID=UPI0035315B4E
MAQVNIDRRLKHLFDGGEWNVYDDKVLNLGVGAPGPDLLENCCDIFEAATTHRMYGPTSGPTEVRDAIAEYFSAKYIDNPMKSEDLIITTGASQGLHFVLSTLVDLNGIVFVDEVTYMIALDVLKQFTTFAIIPIKLNKDGVDVKELKKIVQQKRFHSNTKTFWAMYYTVPAYHNPTGIPFSEDVCRSIADLAQKYDFLILCDDVYNILNYTSARPPKRLFTYDKGSGNIISNGSFSKLIGPGVRIGWLEAPARLKAILDASGIIDSGGCFNHYTAGIIASLFELKLAQAHIDKTSTAYKERMFAACDVLEHNLPAICNWTKPWGGYFIWITLPAGVDATKFLKYSLEEEKISFIAGSRFAANPKVAVNSFRLSIAFHGKQKLTEGLTRLCGALKRFLAEEQK